MNHGTLKALVFLHFLLILVSCVALDRLMSQHKILEVATEVGNVYLQNHDRTREALGRIDSLEEYQEFANLVINSRTQNLRGFISLSDQLSKNIRSFTIVLLIAILGIIATGMLIYFRRPASRVTLGIKKST